MVRLGANLVQDGAACEFAVWAPHVNKVTLWLKSKKRLEEKPANGSGSDAEQLVMNPVGNAIYALTVEGVQHGDEYYYLIDSNHNDCFKSEGAILSRRDPYARWTEFTSNICYVYDPKRFEWSPFSAPTWDQLSIYELHCATFVGYHDGLDEKPLSIFEKVTTKLDFIKDELGFNAIQLMPVHEFGGEWGYNPRLLMSIHGKFGTPDQLRTLIDEAHKRGIAVLFDLVLNHGSSKLNSLWNWDGYGPNNNGGIYFEGGGDTPWGRKFSFHKKEIRDMLLATCEMFIEEYHGDGLRFDSVHNNPWDLLQYLTYNIHHKYPGRILISEIVPEVPAVISEAGFDSTWIHSSYFDSLKLIKSKPTNMGILKSMISMHSGFGHSINNLKYMLGCHDSSGDKHNGGMDGGIHRYSVQLFGGRKNWHARAQCRLLHAMNIAAPCVPMLWMGAEVHHDGWWNVDHHHRYNWDFARDDIGKEMMALVKDLNELRLKHSAMTKDTGRPMFVHEDGQGILAFKRATADSAILAVVNCSDSQYERNSYGVHTGTQCGTNWKEVFNSQWKCYGGWDDASNGGERSTGGDGKIYITVPKWSVMIFARI